MRAGAEQPMPTPACAGLQRAEHGGQEPEEPTSACPYCHAGFAETELECPACGGLAPYCIVTGKHMVVDDWCPAPGALNPRPLSTACPSDSEPPNP